MAGEKERMVILEEFMKNTGTDKDKAVNILNRNQWNLLDSYSEIEKMCVSSGHGNVQHNQIRTHPPSTTSPPGYCAVETGLGSAVNLDNSKNVSLQHQSNISCQPIRMSLPYSTFPRDSTSSYGIENLSVMLPNMKTSTYEPRHVPVPSSVKQHSPQAKVTESSSNQSRVSNPSRLPVTVPCSHSHNKDHVYEEEEDVFDENFVSKKQFIPNTYPRLKRGFSNIIENEELVSEARQNVQTDIQKDSHDNMYVKTFILPNLVAYKEGFRAFVLKELIETSTLVSLEQAGRLNWWAEMRVSQRLMPMATSGDGNCLLHAASLAMWGIHDRQLILRKELNETLTRSRYKDALYRRWRYQQTLGNKESGLVFNEAEWKAEWDNVLRLASPQPRGACDPSRQNSCCESPLTQRCQEPVVYESLEEFHVFVLAHVLQRPIIVVADTFLKSSSGEALAPIPFAGIYLPFEVHPCYRSPLLLTYDAAHFSALVPMEQDPQAYPVLPAAIPLMDPELKLLPIHFCVDPLTNISKHAAVDLTLEDKVNLLKKMLDVEKIHLYSTDQNGDSDIGSCGSHESDEMGPSLREKDKKKDDKKKQGQTVAKQFGSLGKTVGKKLKQLGKGNREKPRRPSITQSTAITSLDHYNPRDVVLVARLSEKRGKQQQEMIQNYLQDAHARFKLDHELKRKSDIELRSKIAPHPAVASTTNCKTPGCPQIGVPEASFFCSKCNAARQREDQNSHLGVGVSQYSYNTFPGRGRQQNLPPDEIFCYGYSKFYTSSNEDVNNRHQSGNPTVLKPLDPNTFQSSGNIKQVQARSPSPNYDNIEYRKSNVVFLNDAPTEEMRKCVTVGCEFYGSHASNYMCSKCYQKKYKEILDGATHHSTNL